MVLTELIQLIDFTRFTELIELTEFIEFNASKIEKRKEVEIAAEDLITLINIVINQVKEFLDLTKK